jgi:malate/lactate dehydrogenase
MRHKVTCIASSKVGELIALLIAQLDLAALVILSGPEGLADDVAGAAPTQGYEPRVRAGTWADAAGSDLVVLDAVDDDAAAEIAARCAGAVVVVATPTTIADVHRLLADTRLPRARIVGAAVDGAGPITAAARATELADAVLRDRRRTIAAAVQVLDEAGDAADVVVRDARIGAGGIQAIL